MVILSSCLCHAYEHLTIILVNCCQRLCISSTNIIEHLSNQIRLLAISLKMNHATQTCCSTGNLVQLAVAAGNLRTCGISWQQWATTGNHVQQGATDRHCWKPAATATITGQLQATMCNWQALLETCGNSWQKWATVCNCEQQWSTVGNSV